MYPALVTKTPDRRNSRRYSVFNVTPWSIASIFDLN